MCTLSDKRSATEKHILCKEIDTKSKFNEEIRKSRSGIKFRTYNVNVYKNLSLRMRQRACNSFDAIQLCILQ